MKKLFVLIVLLLCLVGCDDKKIEEEPENVIVTKKDENKDYLMPQTYKTYVLSDGRSYNASWLDINLNSEEMSNLSLTLKNNILLNTKGFEMVDGNVIKGTIVEYKYYEGVNYLSIVEESVNFFNNTYGSTTYNVYNIDISKGIIVDNDTLLSSFNKTEEDIFNSLRNSDISDSDYVIMYIKNNGYNLYVNSDNKLVLSFVYVNDEEEIKKELVLN